jgi:3-oxoacyl-[acyl-carrier-protein] synthase-3
MTENAVYITKASSFLPNAPVANDDMERILGQVGRRPSRARKIVLRSNKITSRYYAIDPDTLQPTHTNAQLSAEAVRGF